MSTALTDAERAFAGSPQGASQLAAARHHHALSQTNKGNRAQPWTEAMEADATRKLATSHRWEDN